MNGDKRDSSTKETGRHWRLLDAAYSPLLERLTVQERLGKVAFRHGQEGPGYDRNLATERVVLVAIDDIHNHPVQRRLAAEATP